MLEMWKFSSIFWLKATFKKIGSKSINTQYFRRKTGLKSEDTEEFLHLQHKYSKSLSWAENLNFPPKTVNNLFKFSPQDSDLEYLCWRYKNSPVSSDLFKATFSKMIQILQKLESTITSVPTSSRVVLAVMNFLSILLNIDFSRIFTIFPSPSEVHLMSNRI